MYNKLILAADLDKDKAIKRVLSYYFTIVEVVKGKLEFEQLARNIYLIEEVLELLKTEVFYVLNPFGENSKNSRVYVITRDDKQYLTTSIDGVEANKIDFLPTIHEFETSAGYYALTSEVIKEMALSFKDK